MLTMRIKETDSNSDTSTGFNHARISRSIVFFLYGTIFAAWAARIPDIEISPQLKDSQFGAVLMTMPLGTIIFLLFSGKIISRYNTKLIILGSFMLLNLSLLGLSLLGSKDILVFSLFLFGLFGNTLNVAINTAVASHNDRGV
ncbi:hypothetical protein CIN01S_04_04790 [Chryseobacterium indologenes NBRC 14944]|nr:hypothetical protein CIN01S_04_04790 [Chryseobacterium indologenes NBRC 14944]